MTHTGINTLINPRNDPPDKLSDNPSRDTSRILPTYTYTLSNGYTTSYASTELNLLPPTVTTSNAPSNRPYPTLSTPSLHFTEILHGAEYNPTTRKKRTLDAS
jgi:hypothetical protein